MIWKKRPIENEIATLNSKLSNSVYSKRVTSTSNDSVRITASSDRQGFLIFGGTNSPTVNMMCLINIDSRMQTPLVLNLGSRAANAAYGDSNTIINATLMTWSTFVVLSDSQFDVTTI